MRSEATTSARVDLLEAYRDTYLAEEVRNEGLVRNLDGFARFLDVAALMNAQVLNVTGIARDAGVSRSTVQGFFEVLADTMIGTMLPAWRPRARVKEVANPKFYLFDTGVARTVSGRLREPLHSTERGQLLEAWVLHELAPTSTTRASAATSRIGDCRPVSRSTSSGSAGIVASPSRSRRRSGGGARTATVFVRSGRESA